MLAPEDLAPEHRAVLDGLDARGSLINLYRAMAHSPVALHRFIDLASCLWSGALSPRLMEVAILSVASASDAPYPLGWHLLDAEAAGLSPHEIDAVVRGDAAAIAPPEAARVAGFARALTLDARVDDATFRAVAGFMDERQIVELAMLVGVYRLVACIANGLHVDLDDEPARKLDQMPGQRT